MLVGRGKCKMDGSFCEEQASPKCAKLIDAQGEDAQGTEGVRGCASPWRSLALDSSLPHVLAQLRSVSLAPSAGCTSLQSPVPTLCWSQRVVRETRDAEFRGQLFSDCQVLQHAMELLCGRILGGCADIVAALLPEVQDEHSLGASRPAVHMVFEELLTGRRTISLARATRQQEAQFPYGALVALSTVAAEQAHLVYSPHFADTCTLFEWGTVGYLQLVMEALRMLAYITVGYILPSWLSGVCYWSAAGTRTQPLPPKPLLVSGGASGPAAGLLHMGCDPGLWALDQMFRTRWMRVCSAPDTAAAGTAGCQHCASKRAHPSPPSDAPPPASDLMARTLCSPILRSSAPSSASGSCLTAAASPLLVMERHGVGQAPVQPAALLRHVAPQSGAVVFEHSNRFGSSLHRQAPEEYLHAMRQCCLDYFEPSQLQVCSFGCFRHRGAAGREAAAEAQGVHVDLLHGDWGRGFGQQAVHVELAQRQGQTALVPGALGEVPCCFYVPALAQAPCVLDAAMDVVQGCRTKRLWSGCHQCAQATMSR